MLIFLFSMLMCVHLAVTTAQGKNLFSPDDLQTITVANAAQLKQLEMIGRGYITDLVYAPDGKQLAVATSIGIWLYNMSDFDQQPYLLPTTYVAKKVVFSEDGTLLAIVAHDVEIWNVAKREHLATLKTEHTNGFYALDMSFQENNTRLQTIAGDGIIDTWDIASARAIPNLQVQLQTTFEVGEFDAAGNLAATTTYSPENIDLWDRRTWKQIGSIPVEGYLSNIDFNSDGRFIALEGENISFYDTKTQKQIAYIPDFEAQEVVFSHDGEWVAAAGTNGHVHVWRWDDLLAGDSNQGTAFEGDTNIWVTQIAFSADNNQLVTADAARHDFNSISFDEHGDGSLRVWDVKSARQTHLIVDHYSEIGHAKFIPNSPYLITLVPREDIHIWDVYAGEQAVNLSASYLPYIFGDTLPTSVDGRFLAYQDNERIVHIWDVAERRDQTVIRHYVPPMQGVGAGQVILTFSHDGRILATANQFNLYLWDVETGAELAVTPSHTDNVTTLLFNDTDTLIASTGLDGVIRIYGVVTSAQDN